MNNIKFHVLNSEIERLSNPSRTFTDKLFDTALYFLGGSSSVLLKLRLQPYIYLRASVLCEDITVKAESKRNFTIINLIELLYEDFLVKVRNNNDLFLVYQQLMAHLSRDPELKSYAGFYPSKDENKITSLDLYLSKKQVLRGEVFIRDLTFHVEELNLSIEVILETLLTDFVTQYCSGKVPMLLDDLIDNLE